MPRGLTVLVVLAVCGAMLGAAWVWSRRGEMSWRPPAAGSPPSAEAAPASAVQDAVAHENPDWWRAIQEGMTKDEYRPSAQAADAAGTPFEDGVRLHFVNRAQGLRAYFSESGPELRPRESADWRWRMTLVELARDGGSTPIPTAAPAIGGEEIVYEREWGREIYRNASEGIEQVFEISARPGGGGGSLKIRLKTEGLRVPSVPNDSVVFATDSGDVLSYGKLAVTDAEGKPVPSRLHWEDGTIALVIDDDGAAYPILVDPLLASPSLSIEPNVANSSFGSSAVTAGDVNGDGYSDVLIGAHEWDNGQTNEGAVFLYLGSSTGLSTTVAWSVESNQDNALLGRHAYCAGDVNGDSYADVIVSAYPYSNPEATEGKAWVFHGSPSGLTPGGLAAANWSAESDQAGAKFAGAPAGDLNGDGYSDVVCCAGAYDGPEVDEGKAYVYFGSASGLSVAPSWTWETDQAGANLGAGSAAGDVNGDGYADLLLGSQFYNGKGRAYIFYGSATGPSSTPGWTKECDQTGGRYGGFLNGAGDVNGDGYADVLVGAIEYDNPFNNEGQVWLYYGGAAGLSTIPAWSYKGGQADAYLAYPGISVNGGDYNGDGYADVAIGVRMYDNGQSDEGVAYVFYGSSNGLASSPDWTNESNQGGANYGWAAGNAGDVNGDGFDDLIVSAMWYDNGQTDEGRVYFYYGSAAAISTAPAWTFETNQANATIGASRAFAVASAGDVNGDGYDDVIVGAPFYDNGEVDEGKVWAFYGTATGLPAAASWEMEGNQADSRFGFVNASAGDVNGDGFSDVLVGACRYDRGEFDEGVVFVYYGSSTGLPSAADVILEGNGTDSDGMLFGRCVGTAGDVNGDGYSDVIITAALYENPDWNEGGVFVFLGSASGLSPVACWSYESNQYNAQLGNGSCAGTARDVNRDGCSDIIVGIPYYDVGALTDAGRVVVFHGSKDGLPATPNWIADGTQANAQFGLSLSTAGDVNGDGYSDVIVGAPYYDNPESDEGRVYVYYGSASGLGSTPWTAESNSAMAKFGTSVSTAGDVNGDGCSDVIIGAPSFIGPPVVGKIYVYFGSGTGLAGSAGWTAQGEQDICYFGSSVATAGDVNGDGYSEILTSAYGYDNPEVNEGRSYLYYGSGRGGLVVRPRQMTSNGSRPIQVLGASSASGVLVRVLARTPAGRTRARLQVEVKPIGSPFNGTGLITGTWTTIAITGTNLQVAASGLAEGAYHWRARLQYFPYLGYTHWLSVGPNGARETDFVVVFNGPAIWNLSPASGTWVTTDTPALTASVMAPGAGVAVHGEFSIDAWDFVDGSDVITTGTTTYVTTPLPQGTHTWVARAHNAADLRSDYSSAVTFRVDSIPPTVGAPTVSPNPSSTGIVSLTWSAEDSMSGLASIEVQRSDNGGPYATVATLGGGVTAWTQSPSLLDGTYAYRISALDVAGNRGTSGVSGDVTVDKLSPPPPSLVSPADLAVVDGASVALDWNDVVDVSGVTYRVEVSSSPSFLTLTYSASGLTDSESAAGPFGTGTWYWRVRATDGVGHIGGWSAARRFVVDIGITTSSLPPGGVGAAYSATIGAAGGQGPHFYSVTAGTLPAGLGLSPLTGEISGTATVPGVHTFTVTVTDSSEPPLTTSKSYTLSVFGTVSALTIPSTSPLPDASAGSPYRHLFVADGGVQPYAWKVASGSLPPGLSLSSSTGLISGTPTVAGSSTFDVRVSDSNSPFGTTVKSFSLAVVGATDVVSASSAYPQPDGLVDFPTIIVGTPFSTTFAAPGATSWNVSSGTLPTGLTLNAATGQVSGTPTEPGTWSFVLRAENAGGTVGFVAARIMVAANGGTSFLVRPETPPALNPGSFYSWTPVAAGGTAPYDWSILAGALPAGLSLNSATGEISGIPAGDAATFTIAAIDFAGDPATRVITLAPAAVAGTSGSSDDGGRCGLLGIEAAFVMLLLGLRRRRGLALVAVLAICAAIFAGAVLWPKAPIVRVAVAAPARVDAVKPAVESAIAKDNPDWWASVQEDIRRQEYRPSMQERDSAGAAFEAGPRAHFVNRAEGLRAYFGEGGAEVRAREGSDWRWNMVLEGLARGEWGVPCAAAAPSIDGDQVVYERGWGREVYRNTEEGIEQIFEIRDRPGAGESPLEIRLRAKGLRVPSVPHESIVFATDERDVLTYGKLQVRDAAGREVGSRIAWRDDGEIALVIEDGEAQYPILVDPLLTSPGWTAEGNMPNTGFGVCASTAGDVNGDGYGDVLVGASGWDNGETNEGAAFLFLGSAGGLQPTPSWSVEADQTQALLGRVLYSIGDVNGDGYGDVAVSSYPYDNGETDEGKVWVFYGSVTGLKTGGLAAADWTKESNQIGAYFTCAPAGDVNGDGYSDVFGTSSAYDNGQTNEGMVWLYLGSAAGLPGAASWSYESDQADTTSNQNLGAAVTAGDVNGDGYGDIVLGAQYFDNGQADEGRIFLFYGSATGPPAAPNWTMEIDQAGARFGASLWAAGDVNGDGFDDFVVYAPYFDNGETDEGRVYLYYGSANGPQATPWTYETNQVSAVLGYPGSGVQGGDFNGDGFSDLIVGAYLYDSGETDEGRAYVFYGSFLGLPWTPAWTVESNQTSASFGHSVSNAGDVNGDGCDEAIVGALNYDNPDVDEGRVYLYYGSRRGLSVTPSWTAEGNQTLPPVDNYGLGWALSTAGDVNGDGFSDVIVGFPAYDNGTALTGRAYAYYGSATGLPSSASWMKEGVAGEGFASSISTAGDVNGDGCSDVIIGCSLYDNGQTNEGRVVLYYGSAGGLSAASAWSYEGNQAGSDFGVMVATAGDINGDGYSDVIAASCYWDNGALVDAGRVTVFHGSAAGLPTSPNWSFMGDQNGALVGASAATAGDVNGDGYADVIVAGNGYDDPEVDEGKVWVFHGSAGGLPLAANWTTDSDQAGGGMGWYYAANTAGDVNGDGYADVIIGAVNYDNVEANEGRVFVYHGSATGLAASPARTLEINVPNAGFGHNANTAGDLNGDGYADVVIGAPYYRNGEAEEGAVFVCYGSATGLAAQPSWMVEGNQAYAHFGWFNVSTAGDVNGDGYSDILVGAPHFDAGQTDEGKVFVYCGSAAGLALKPAWFVESGRTGAQYGFSVAGAGDVNGDGFADVIVGAPMYDNGEAAEGMAFLYLGSATGLSSTAAWSAEGTQINAYFGYSVGTAGDVNGDGYSDVIVGAYQFDGTLTNEGAAFVYAGSAAGLSATADWTLLGGQTDGEFGFAVASAGDVNGDGYSDVIVGARLYDAPELDEGAAFVFYGSSAGLSLTPAWTMDSDQPDSRFGRSVSSAGDVNGDGYSDVIVGYVRYSNGETFEGRAVVYHGAMAGLSNAADWFVESNQINGYLGYAVGCAGDVNGDGYSDAIVSAHGYDNGQTDEGKVWVYYGSALGLLSAPSWTAEGNQPGAWFGIGAAGAGDVNGDGYSDVIVSSEQFDHGQLDEGRVFVYHGSALGLRSGPGWTAELNKAGAWFGESVAKAGDVNGDGFDDVIIGASKYSNGETEEGAACVYYGNGGAGLVRRARQLRDDGTTPVQLGCGQSTTAKIRLAGLTPAGRTKARLQVELKALGVPFDGDNLVTGAWTDTGVGGTDLELSLTGLALGSYHWRARLQYYPHLSYGHWFSAGPNGAQEADFRVSDKPPLISTPLPVDGAWVKTATPTLSASVSAPEGGQLVRAEFSIDGGPFSDGATVTTSGLSSFTAPALSDGIHTWVARAEDGNGNRSANTASITLNVDTTAPLVGAPTASPNPNSTGGPVISWAASDGGSGLATIAIERSDNGGAFAVVAALAGTATNWTQSPALTDGTSQYRVIVTDVAGNAITSPASAPVIVDTLMPGTPVPVSPADGASLQTAQVALDWTDVTDASGVGYEVEVAPDATFSSLAWSGSGIGSSNVTTAALTAGAYCWRVRAVDGAGGAGGWSDVRRFTVLIGITTASLPAGSTGSAYSVTLATTGGTAPVAFEVSAGTLPPGLSLSPLTGEVLGTPTAPGTYEFTVTAADSTYPPLSSRQTYAIVVTGAPAALTIPASSLADASQGIDYAHIFEASGGVRPYSWSIAAGTVPPGLELSASTGILSGQAAMGGTFSFTVTVTDDDAVPSSASADFTLSVIAQTGSALAVSTCYPISDEVVRFPPIVTGTPFSTTFHAAGAISWSVTSGSLPTGLAMNAATGQISGTASTTGTWRFAVRATDASGNAAFLVAEMTVAVNGGASVQVLPPAAASGSPGRFYSWTLTAAGGATAYSWSIVSGSLPAGVGLNAATGELSGTPSEPGTWAFTAMATDSSGVPTTATRTFSITTGQAPSSGGGGRCGLLGIEVLLAMALLGLRRCRGR